MEQALKCVIVDDDRMAVELLSDMCNEFPFVEIVDRFCEPLEFLEAAPKLSFNTCLLDIYMPRITGLEVAEKIPDKSVIFVTGEDTMLRAALAHSPIGVLTKPVVKRSLNEMLLKAYSLQTIKELRSREYKLFNTRKGSKKVNIHASDILYVAIDIGAPRDKHIYLRNGEDHVLSGCTFEELLSFAPMLVQVNKTELISIENIYQVENDIIILKDRLKGRTQRPIVISRSYKRDFFERMQ